MDKLNEMAKALHYMPLWLGDDDPEAKDVYLIEPRTRSVQTIRNPEIIRIIGTLRKQYGFKTRYVMAANNIWTFSPEELQETLAGDDLHITVCHCYNVMLNQLSQASVNLQSFMR